jgi:DNA-binding IclR family transcriptional regulator
VLAYLEPVNPMCQRLGKPNRLGAVPTATVERTKPLEVEVDLGTVTPSTCTASGRAATHRRRCQH